MFAQRTFYVLMVALILIPFLIKKAMSEMPIISYLLFISVLLFILITGIDLATSETPTYDLHDYLKPRWSTEIISSISILALSFYYQTGVFPAYSSMENKSTHNFMMSGASANLICALVYITLGVLCLAMFGSELQSDVLLNMATRPGISSIILRLVFAFLLMMHIPYVFFTTKDASLVLIDELQRSTISEHLKAKLIAYKEQREEEQDEERTKLISDSLSVNSSV